MALYKFRSTSSLLQREMLNIRMYVSASALQHSSDIEIYT